MKKTINWLSSKLVLLTIMTLMLIGKTSFVFAVDNTSANDLQQLQALQDQMPKTSPVRPNLQLTLGDKATTSPPRTTPNTVSTPPPPPNNLNSGVTDPAAGIVTSPYGGQASPPPPAPQAGDGFTNQSPGLGQPPGIVIQSVPQTPVFQAPFTPPTVPGSESDLSRSAFNSVVNTALPMTPDQIHRLKQLFTATQYAQAAPPGIPPRPVATSQIVNLAPGATPPVIRLAQGFVTSLVFIDSTGAPWPIDSYSIGDPQRFNLQWNKTDNTLMIQAMSLYNYGNLAVRLKGLVTPVMLTLIPGQKDIDYRVDLRIQGLGPNAAPVLGECLPGSANPLLLGVLEGIPPAGSKELSVCGADFQAWLLGDKMYIRTHFTILSPAWRATMSSADGTKAYEMQKTPMLLVSLHGKAVPIKIEGF